MLELFGVSKCHGVERDGKGQRGFRGVRFNDSGGQLDLQPTALKDD